MSIKFSILSTFSHIFISIHIFFYACIPHTYLFLCYTYIFFRVVSIDSTYRLHGFLVRHIKFNDQWLAVFTNLQTLYWYLPNPSARAGYDTRSIFKRSLTGLNSEFSFSYTSCLTKAKEPNPSYYLPIAGGRIIGFIPFPRVLVLCEMQSVSSRIWTRIVVSNWYAINQRNKTKSIK